MLAQSQPKEEDAEQLRAYRGSFADLTPQEQYLYVISSVPRLKEKISLLGSIPSLPVRRLPHSDQFPAVCPVLPSPWLCQRPGACVLVYIMKDLHATWDIPIRWEAAKQVALAPCGEAVAS